LINEDRIEDEAYWTNLNEKVIGHPKFYQTLLSYFVQLPVDDFNPHKPPPKTPLLEEMAEATRDYAETYILKRDWYYLRLNQDKQCVSFQELWNGFDRWIDNDALTDGSKYKGKGGTFYSRVRMWVNKWKSSGVMVYAPNEKLLARWAKEDADDAGADGFVAPVRTEKTSEEIHEELVANQRRNRAEKREREIAAEAEKKERRALLETKIAELGQWLNAVIKTGIGSGDELDDAGWEIMNYYDGVKDELDELLVDDLLRDLENLEKKRKS
jgi:hypothetical protein